MLTVLSLKSIIHGSIEGWVMVYVCLFACVVGVNAHISAYKYITVKSYLEEIGSRDERQ